MINETIDQIAAKIQTTDSLSNERRRELAELLTKLKSEAKALSETHAEQAQSIVGFAQVTAHEATRADQNPTLLSLSSAELKNSVVEFEQSHPRLAQVVNSISTTLSSSGI